jgi:hypothetical protein
MTLLSLTCLQRALGRGRARWGEGRIFAAAPTYFRAAAETAQASIRSAALLPAPLRMF